VGASALVTKLQAFVDLDRHDLAQLEQLSRQAGTVKAKHDLISEGDPAEHVHLMIDGWAARYKLLSNGKRQIMAFLLPGDFCDLHVALLGQMDHGIIALTECKVAYVESSDLDDLIFNNDRLTRALWWVTLQDEAVLRRWVVNVGRRDAYERIAHIFCEIHARMTLIGRVDDDRLTLPLTQDELADATGLTAVHTNRTLQRLRQENLIEIGGGSLRILDVNALREAGGFDPKYLHVQQCGR
jgi:CRP-like cAMP-binding protein